VVALAVLLASCGGHPKDSAVAHRILAKQLALLRRAERGRSLKNGGAAYSLTNCEKDAGAATSTAVSSYLDDVAGGAQIAVEDALFPSGVFARRAVQSLGGHAAEWCRSRPLRLPGLHNGPVTLSAPKVVRAGTAAIADQASVVSKYLRQHHVVYVATVIVSQGRVVVVLETQTVDLRARVLGYDVYLARQFAEIAGAEQTHTAR
jgi:hypothetical protein